MTEVLNWLLTNWDVTSAVLVAIVGWIRPSFKEEFKLLVEQIEFHAETNPNTGKQLKVEVAEAAKKRGRGFFRKLGRSVEKITKQIIKNKTGIEL